ncbi:MAG TPA: superinfection immunity protein [Actinomycetota bacterium]|jgi:hypothetical protein|nr:superinfection immunity protein [Actinomycetota bacterium]
MSSTLMAAGAYGNGANPILGLLVLGGLIAAYFVPTIVALVRHTDNVVPVAIINFFLGWTFIGWVVALAMACKSPAPTQHIYVHQGEAPPASETNRHPPDVPPPTQEDGAQWVRWAVDTRRITTSQASGWRDHFDQDPTTTMQQLRALPPQGNSSATGA